jgi:hypothetical protein
MMFFLGKFVRPPFNVVLRKFRIQFNYRTKILICQFESGLKVDEVGK